MNDTVRHELEVLVERCVRPVRAPFASKKRMREDLFSHLSFTFEAEFARRNDETQALARTRERFGDPAEVSRELQRSVPMYHRFSYCLEWLLAWQPGESFLHLALKHQFAGFLYFCALAVLGLSARLYEGKGGPAAMLWNFADMIVVMCFLGTLAQWLADRMGRALHSSDPRARRLKWRYGLLSMLMFPGVIALNSLGLGIWFGPQAMLPVPFVSIATLVVAPVGLVVTRLLGPITAERTLYQEKWAALDVAAE